MKLGITLGLVLTTGSVNAGWFGPSNFEECILDGMKGVASDSAAYAIAYACRSKFPLPPPPPPTAEELRKTEEELRQKKEEYDASQARIAKCKSRPRPEDSFVDCHLEEFINSRPFGSDPKR